MGEIVELNVGGQYFTTTRTTLTKDPDSVLAAMFSGRHTVLRDKSGRYFLDCDGGVFKHILEYLRFGRLPPCQHYEKVKEYGITFGLQNLVSEIENAPFVELNLRGQYLTVARETVEDLQTQFPDSNLTAILSKGEDLPIDSTGRYFVDANRSEFKLLLDTVKYNTKCTESRVAWVKTYFGHYLGLMGSKLRKYFS